jgi:hypothetical protein
MTEDGQTTAKRPHERMRLCAAVLFFLVLVLAATYPVSLYPTHLLVGAEYSDLWDHLWGYWRTEKALFIEGQLPFEERHINHPYGGQLYHVDFLNSLFMLPMRWIFGMPLAYNVLVWGQIVLGCTAMMLLARRFAEGWAAPIFAGIAFGFAPHMLCFTLGSGVANRLNIAWIPFFFLFFFKLVEGGKYRNAIYAALFFLLAALGCWHYAYFIFLITVFLSIRSLSVPLWRKLRGTQENLGRCYAKLTSRLGLLAASCALAAVPISRSASGSMSSDNPDAIYSREHSLFWDGKTPIDVINEFKPMDFFTPGKPGLLMSYNFDQLYETAYLGFVLLFSATLAIFSRKSLSLYLVPVILFFLGLALGPTINAQPPAQPSENPLFYAAARTIPFMTAQEVPWEYTIPAIFCLCISAAIGISWLCSLLKPKWLRGSVGVGFIAALLYETFTISPPIMPVPYSRHHIPEFYQTLAADADDYAVFDFPSRRAGSSLLPTEYFYYQTVHHKPIPYAILDSWLDKDEFWMRFTRTQQIGTKNSISSLMTCQAGSPRGCGYIHRVKFALAKNGFRYFILHPKRLADRDRSQYKTLFAEMFGEPMHEDEDLMVYRLEKAE